MPRSTHSSSEQYFLYSFVFWFPLLFATPFFIALKNMSDVHVSLPYLGCVLVAFTLTATLLTGFGLRILSVILSHRLASLLLALAAVLVLQGNVIHDLFSYAQFNGEEMDWQLYGNNYWQELAFFAFAIPVTYLIVVRYREPLVILPLALLASSAFLLATGITGYDFERKTEELEVDPKVFSFSAQRNIIHLLADGMQSDVTKQVLEDHPALAEKFAGFTLFDNHTAQFQGTAPSVSTLFTGQVTDLNKGYTFKRISDVIGEKAYQLQLADDGYRLDYVTINGAYCIEAADSCTERPFNFFKSRGYYDGISRPLEVTLGFLADLTLFRHLPLFFKQRVYNDGSWLMATNTRDTFASQYPDQVIREWVKYMDVTSEKPVYKLYHFIGTHVPPRWDAECIFTEGLEASRENTFDQTYCVLTTIASLLDKLRSEGIYDETMIVLTGDHGAAVAAYDIQGKSRNSSISHGFIGHARPVFMVKKLDDRSSLGMNSGPTTMVDVAPTILQMIGQEGDFDGYPAFSPEVSTREERFFHRYVGRKLFGGLPVPYTEYRINGDSRVAANWEYVGIHNVGIAPAEYPRVSFKDLNAFSIGLNLDREVSRNEAWVGGLEFAFLLSAGEAEASALALDLRVPEEARGQTVRLQVNGHWLGDPLEINPSGERWTEVHIPLESVELQQQNNFIKIRFGTQFINAEGKPVSVLLRTIRPVTAER